MDSVTLAYHLRSLGHDLDLLAIDYGQRHRKELDFARLAASRLEANFSIVDLSSVTSLISSSSLTGEIEVPDGHYAQDTMKITVVPNRNMMMLSIASAVAISKRAQFVATGVHGGDHFIYPDCRPDFVAAVNEAVQLGNEGFDDDFRGILAPFIDKDKAFIAAEGDRLGVPWTDTWSCYKGGARHCGRCGTCVERQEAFSLAGVDDPTEYDDPDFWRRAVEEAKG